MDRSWYMITNKIGEPWVGQEYGHAIVFLLKDDAQTWAEKNMRVEYQIRAVIIVTMKAS